MDLSPSSVVAGRGRPKLSPRELKIVAYLSGIAAETPDRRVSQTSGSLVCRMGPPLEAQGTFGWTIALCGET